MKRLSLAALILLTLFSCSSNKSANISGKIEGATDGSLVLTLLEVSSQKIVDTIKYNSDGEFSAKVNLLNSTPNFYYLYYNNNRVGSMVLKAGDKIEILSDTLGREVQLSGSQESEQLLSLERSLNARQKSFDSLTTLMAQANEREDSDRANELNLALGALYVKTKQDAIRYIYTNPTSITSMIPIYYSFATGVPLFADTRDMFLFKMVYDSLSFRYPGTIYLTTLMNEISSREKLAELNNKLQDISEIGFPELSLPNAKSQIERLSELSGRVVILSFWSAQDPSQKMLNLDYLELYSKYNSRGLEIYQVCVDSDKTAWATAVREQQLPWISVCDGLGANSIALSTYDIREVPVNFIIDKTGTIVDRDLYGEKLESRIASLTR